MNLKLTLCFALLWIPIFGFGQTCCSAGAPLISNFGVDINAASKYNFGLEYNSRAINRLVDHNEILQNDPRRRNGQNVLLKSNIKLNKHFLFGMILPVVIQNRNTFSETQSSTGLGDIVFITQYSFWTKKEQAISFASSIKLPTGKTGHLDDRGIFISPDMQSGSGTFDWINRISFSAPRLFNKNWNLQIGALYRLNGTNSDFAKSGNSPGRAFKFGNEFQILSSINYELLVGTSFLVPGLELQYRHSNPNEEQHFKLPNSGGDWINLNLSLFLRPPKKVNYRTYVVLPVWQNLQGLQITTNLEWGLELNYQF